ncbi:MAG: phosphoribosyltransferase [Ignavibacteria bacterium]|jgi:hypothetical protein|nr:phosphoribosyltransferase [Ignavibacteria bacterium]
MKYKTLEERITDYMEKIKEMNEGVKSGKQGKYVFGYKRNDDFEDFLIIHPELKVKKTHGGNEYWFGYEYNINSEKYQEFEKFRKALKSGKLKINQKDEYNRFLRKPIEFLAKRTTLNHIDAVFFPDSESSLFDDIVEKIFDVDIRFLSKYNNKTLATFSLFKEQWNDVIFDDIAYKDWLMNDSKMRYDEEEAEIMRLTALESFKNLVKDNKNTWFEMKKVIPITFKPFVRKFFKFTDEQVNKMNVFGFDTILIIDDILTTGSTTDEITRMLREMNSKYKIIRLVLIDMGVRK